jgi:hypothetical protein
MDLMESRNTGTAGGPLPVGAGRSQIGEKVGGFVWVRIF